MDMQEDYYVSDVYKRRQIAYYGMSTDFNITILCLFCCWFK